MMAAKREERVARGKKEGAVKRQTISIIGAGRIGTALARALAARGYTIEAVVAKRKSHAERAAKVTGTRPLILTSSELERLPASDILLITTPDDAIETTASRLAALAKSRCAQVQSLRGRGKSRRTALHASGALSSDILQSLGDVGFTTGSMHPLISVSDPIQGSENLRSAYFCIEGEEAARRTARSLVSALGAQSFSINTADKALYHAAAVMASGHVTALFDLATEMLNGCGLSRPSARKVLLPLLRSTLENLGMHDPARALTGTFARADLETVRRHLNALRPPPRREALAVYTLLGLRSLRLAKAAGASRDRLKEIESVLAKALSVLDN